MADVFVSYSRRDTAYVKRLVEALQERGKDVWVDVEGIRDAEVFPAALRRAVEGSDGFVFVISPDSVQSPFCEQEVDRAVELNKRVVPLLLRAVPDERDPGRDPVSQLDPGGRRRRVRRRRRAPRQGARHRPRLGAGAHALAVEGARVGRRGPRPQLPAARLGAGGRRAVAGGECRQGARLRRRSSANTRRAAAPRRRAGSARSWARASAWRRLDRAARVRADLAQPGDQRAQHRHGRRRSRPTARRSSRSIRSARFCWPPPRARADDAGRAVRAATRARRVADPLSAAGRGAPDLRAELVRDHGGGVQPRRPPVGRGSLQRHGRLRRRAHRSRDPAGARRRDGRAVELQPHRLAAGRVGGAQHHARRSGDRCDPGRRAENARPGASAFSPNSPDELAIADTTT